MPLTVSLASMATDVQRRANIENFAGASGTFITLPEIKGYLNESLAELWDLLVEARGQEFFRKGYTFQTVGNQGGYPLPPDFTSLISMDVYLAPNIVLTATPYMENERNRFRWYPGWFYNMPIYFRILGSPSSTGAALQPSVINFIPAPTATSTVTLNYVPAFRPFATDGTEDNFVFDGVSGWEGFAIWNSTAICLEKMQKDSAYAMGQVEKYRGRIQALAADRHAGDPERVHDVSTDYAPFGVP